MPTDPGGYGDDPGWEARVSESEDRSRDGGLVARSVEEFVTQLRGFTDRATRLAAGAEPYTGGFLGHYALAPVGLDVAGPAVQAGIYTVALVPNVLGYGLLAARGLSRSGDRRAGTVVSGGGWGHGPRATAPGRAAVPAQPPVSARSVSAFRTACPCPSLLK